jgi:hypothetical protein
MLHLGYCAYPSHLPGVDREYPPDIRPYRVGVDVLRTVEQHAKEAWPVTWDILS